MPNFLNNIIRFAAPFLTTCHWDDTICAEFITAIHNINPRFDFTMAHFRKVFNNISLFRPNLNNFCFTKHRLFNQLGQSMNIMRPENQIYMLMLLHNSIYNGLFLGHTATYTKNQVRIFQFKWLYMANFTKYFIFRILPYSACI